MACVVVPDPPEILFRDAEAVVVAEVLDQTVMALPDFLGSVAGTAIARVVRVRKGAVPEGASITYSVARIQEEPCPYSTLTQEGARFTFYLNRDPAGELEPYVWLRGEAVTP